MSGLYAKECDLSADVLQINCPAVQALQCTKAILILTLAINVLFSCVFATTCP